MHSFISQRYCPKYSREVKTRNLYCFDNSALACTHTAPPPPRPTCTHTHIHMWCWFLKYFILNTLGVKGPDYTSRVLWLQFYVHTDHVNPFWQRIHSWKCAVSEIRLRDCKIWKSTDGITDYHTHHISQWDDAMTNTPQPALDHILYAASQTALKMDNGDLWLFRLRIWY